MLEELPKETTYSIMMPEPMRDTLAYVATCLHGNNRRIFMAKTVQSLGVGGQRGAEQLLGWNRKTIRKGMHELQSGISCIDNFSGRGRRPIEYNLPQLAEDIEAIVIPECQTDPTFRTKKIYTPLTAGKRRLRKRCVSA